MSTFPAVVVPGLKQPLTIQQVPTPTAEKDEIRVRVEWVPSAPLDVYQVDAGLMAQFPQSLGDTAAGTVVEAGPDVKNFTVGDRVFGFFFHGPKEKAQQLFVTAPEHLFGKVPDNVSLAAACTLPNNFCTSFFTLFVKLGLELPWPRPDNFVPKNQNQPILIWGGASSVGQYALQILKYWNYTNVIATASLKHHDKIKSYGAKRVFDYRDAGVVEAINGVLKQEDLSEGIIVFDTVSSKTGSLQPISKIATQRGSMVAGVLPVVLEPTTAEDGVKIAPDVSAAADWAEGVQVHSIVTYTYESNPFLKEHLQKDIMATLLAEGFIEPNRTREVTGGTLLERASKALDLMRSGTVSGERLIWKVWTREEFPECE